MPGRLHQLDAKETAILERGPYRVSRRSDLGRYFAVGQAGLSERNCPINVPANTHVLSRVLGALQNLKVLWSVIQLVAVDVVDIFVSRKLAPKMPLHDQPVLANGAADINANKPVARHVNRAAASGYTEAVTGAKEVPPVSAWSSLSLKASAAITAHNCLYHEMHSRAIGMISKEAFCYADIEGVE